jgi:hypothetical protein
MSWVHGGDAIPGDGCDTIQERPIRLPDAKIAELPEHLTILLYDAGLSLRDLPKVSELLAEAFKAGYADGKADGIQAVVDEPEFFFRRCEQ